MIIKKWSGSAWQNQTVKTTAADIFTDDTFATAIFDEDLKIKTTYLPAAALGSLNFRNSITGNISGSVLAPDILSGEANGYPANGMFFVVGSSGASIFAATNGAGIGAVASDGKYYRALTTNPGNSEEDTSNSAAEDLENNDLIIVQSIDRTTAGTLADPYLIYLNVINNTYPNASPTATGVVKLGSSTVQSVAPNAVSSTSSRTYAIQNNSSGQLVVNVPWTDTDTNTTYSAGTGLSLSGTTFNANVDVTTQTVAPNSVTATASRTYAVQVNASDDLVVNVPWTDTNTTYSAGVGLVLSGTTFKANLIDETLRSVTAETISTTANRTYAVMPDADGDLVVNVPWVDTNTTYSKATASALGLVKLEDDAVQSTAANAITTTAGRTYGVQFNSADQLVVNVPWTDTNTTYSEATTSVLGLVKLAFDKLATAPTLTETTTAGRYYGVSLDSGGKMLVNVPWTDTNTTYSAGNGLGLSGTQFSVSGGEGITQETSGVRMTYPLYVQTATPSTSVTNAIWYDIN